MKNNVNKTNKTTAAAAERKAAAEKRAAAKAAAYEEMLQEAKKLIKDNLTVKDATRSVRYSTAGFAVAFCSNFKGWAAYKALFAQLKEDLKKDGVKFAGTPLAKACLAVSTAVIDCHLAIEGDSIEDRITFARQAFKDAKVSFSAKQGDIRIAFGCPTSGDLEKAEAELNAEVIRAVELIQKAGVQSAEGAIQCLLAFVEKEEIAKSKAA